MQAAVRSALLAGLACACHSADRAAPDATGGPDSATVAAGLHVPWSSSPLIPGNGGDLTISNALFRVDSLGVIGDAGPGDPRTSRSTFEVHWNASLQPETINFADAPTGLYSKVTVQADGHLIQNSYEINGTVRLNGDLKNFAIHDLDALTANIDISTMLEPGGGAVVPIRVRFDEALGVIDFATLSVDGGVLDLDTFDAQMPAFRNKLATSFELGDASQ
jgi:hypothetical protein